MNAEANPQAAVEKWAISCRYSGGAYNARSFSTGKSCSAPSERAAVFGLAAKLRPGFPARAIRQWDPGVWSLEKPEAETASAEAGKGRP
jgi:hypothetical protein